MIGEAGKAPRIGHYGKRLGPGRLAALVCLLFSSLVVVAEVAAESGQPVPQIAPPGPMHLRALPPGTGYIPPDIDLSHIAVPMAGDILALPSRFDWREAGKVTPVKNQGACGSCYAFAAIAALESRVLIVEDSTFDFSENNVKECEWYESSCDGGNNWLVANYLTTAGSVLESCDPYVPGDVECTQGCPYRHTLLDWGAISGEVAPSVEVLKSYIETYGPVYTTMYVGSGDAWRAEFSAYDGSYTLYREGYAVPNHAVLIVGWDDDLPHAGGQGGWIVKNSWGASWGGTCDYGTERGYFTIAYGSGSIGPYSSIPLSWMHYSPDDRLLYYDEGGAGGSIGFVGSRTAWGLCKYVPSGVMEINRVEFWTKDVTTDVDIYIYDDFAGGVPSNLIASRLDLSFDVAGYHSVLLTPSIYVNGGEDVYVVVKLTDAVSNFPLSYDTGGPRTPGHCFMSADGSYFFEFAVGDLGIRIRGNTNPIGSEITEAPAIVEITDVPEDGGGYVHLSWLRSVHDAEGGSPAVRRYQIWRKGHETLAPLLGTSAGSGTRIAGPYEHGLTGPAWEVVGTVPATGSPYYGFTAPTERDFYGGDTCWTYFCVTAHRGVIGEHFDSPVERGYSVDNLEGQGPPGGEEDDRYGTGRSGGGSVTLKIPEPNPAAYGFLLEFELGEAMPVELAVYDVRGRRVALLAGGSLEAGSHSISWIPGSDGSPEVPSGLYFVRLATDGELHTAKITLLQ